VLSRNRLVTNKQPPLDKRAEAEIAEEFQSRFLGYLLRNSSRAQIPSFDVSQFSLPVQDLARAFGAAIVGDGELQQKILPLLSVQDEEIRADRASAFDSIVLEAILSFIHQDGWTKVRIDILAEKVSAIYKGRGFDQEPPPERVGWAVKRVGIPSGRMNLSTCRLVHKLAQSHGVRAMQGGFLSDCRRCRELEAMIAQVRRMRRFFRKLGGRDMSSIRDFGTLAQQWRNLEEAGIPLAPLENRVGIDARSAGAS
jgi:hypothetical protein